MTSIADLLRARYPAKTHALMFEVRDGAGFDSRRTCDAIAISTWPSRGLKLMGFEIKASRSDWLRELRNPEKAESFFSVCDEWYLVIDGTENVVEPDELPATWGLLQRKGNRLHCAKAAPLLKPEPIDRSFLAAMLKNCRDAAATPGKVEFDRGYVAGRAAAKDAAVQAIEHGTRELRELRQSLKEFEQASGVTIRNWGGGKIGEAVKFVMEGGHRQHEHIVGNLLHEARRLVSSLEAMKDATA